jgi:hypothetical protein
VSSHRKLFGNHIADRKWDLKESSFRRDAENQTRETRALPRSLDPWK